MSASRKFVDSSGFSWHAVEIVSEAICEPERPAGFLYFLSRGTTRKLNSYPGNWAGLDWAALEDLCSSAELVGSDRGASRARAISPRPATAGAR